MLFLAFALWASDRMQFGMQEIVRAGETNPFITVSHIARIDTLSAFVRFCIAAMAGGHSAGVSG
jgi:hypothetical protein